VLLVFSRQNIDDHFLRAIAVAGSQTCISAARETIRLIYTQYRRRLLNSLCYNLHCSYSKPELIYWHGYFLTTPRRYIRINGGSAASVLDGQSEIRIT
jgi:hypothetical protein